MLKQISKGQLIAIVSFFVNIGVGVLEVAFGFYFHSLALLADGVHSFVDALVSLTVWLGIRYAQKKADGRFHYGYFKFDAIFSLFAAMIMVGSGMVISYTGIVNYLNSGAHHPISLDAEYIVIFSIITAVILAKAKQSYAKKSGLVSLRTDAYNSVKDASASVVAFVGIFLASAGFYSFDSLAGLIIGIFVMVAGYFTVKEASLVLADAYGNPQMIETITDIATSVPGTYGIDDLRVRRSGPFLVVDMHLKVDGNISMFEADRITQEVAEKMRKEIVSLGRITIKPEPRSQGPLKKNPIP
ncbi:MAG: cation diffusion facilitator family transporter [Nitrososphaerales archaeon]